jgi:hypothetical protein
MVNDSPCVQVELANDSSVELANDRHMYGFDGEWQSLFAQVKLLNDSHSKQVELGNDSPCVQMIGEWQPLCTIGAYILAWKHNLLPSPLPKW